MSRGVTRPTATDVRQGMSTSLATSHRPAPHSAGTGPRPRGAWRLVLLAPLVGAAGGAVARGWMRLISDEPEFSWSGTLAVVVAFALLATGHAVAWAARRRATRRRWTTLCRSIGAVLTLAIFVGAGAIMLPTVLGASLARWRSDWSRRARLIAGATAVPAPVIVVLDILRTSASPLRLTGLVLFVATYAAVVTTSGGVVAPVADGWSMPRWLRRCTFAFVVVAGLLAISMTVGIATAR